MTLKQVWEVSPQSFIYVREGEHVVEYKGDAEMGRRTVANMKATSYPMFKSVIEVELDEDVTLRNWMEKAVGQQIARVIGVGSKGGRKIYELMYTDGQCEDWFIDYDHKTVERY